MASSDRIDELKQKFDENPRRYFAPLANEFRKGGDLDQAILICQEFLPQQPGHMSGHIVYGQALYESGRLDEARGVFETALSLDPENLIALRHLGDIAGRQGDPATARRWYERVLEADPRNDEIQGLLAGLTDVRTAETPASGRGDSDRGFDAPAPAAPGLSPEAFDFGAQSRADSTP
jgi:tetratricopeptide (TPR) repeat protein